MRSENSRNFSGHPYIGRIACRLCNSSAFLFKHRIFATDFSFTNKILLKSDCGCLRGHCACSNGLWVVWGGHSECIIKEGSCDTKTDQLINDVFAFSMV